MESKLLLDSGEITRTLERLAYQIMEKHAGCENIMLVGIERRGADLARRLKKILAERADRDVPLGTLDINLYRDDWTSMEATPHVGQSFIPCDVTDLSVVLVDDVLFTGRTIRSALEAILDYGRPASVELLVLIDRGHRELPIQANYVGRTINTSREEHVDVLLEERDQTSEVRISRE
ncbi:MAG: bifunctional pyr operon transcriptional regulator/uracil phosphoribosyltransferase PyrR [Desulfovibrio sp.]|nr:bifunctional pyr operon transcriptional regulator/uracil phosphoribosyltransferase PyrR [Desulfovibrio sp.]